MSDTIDMDAFKRVTMEQLRSRIKSYATVGMADEGDPELTAQEIADFIGKVHEKLVGITDELVDFYCQLDDIDQYFQDRGNYVLWGDAYKEELSEKGIYDMIYEISEGKD